MCSDTVIKVQNLGKCFHIYNQPRDRLKQMILPRLKRIVGKKPRQYFREFWALRDVSFEIKRGETVGIIGRNGSGKSTLLQMICGTLTPSAGEVETNGRVAALLELGSGFNPEFTGRENVYMNAAVLGLSKEETDARFDAVVTFSEIGDFLDQPVKTYSSGMIVRLAFAIAINVDPEILIVDEALSVGDEQFQRKCFSRIESIRENGATILFVSHSGAQIVELCDRAILLDAGELLTDGLPKQIVGLYQKLSYAQDEEREIIRKQIRQSEYKDYLQLAPVIASLEPSDAIIDVSMEQQEHFDPNLKPTSTIEYEAYGACIENVAILDKAGNQVNNLIHGKSYRYTYTVHFTQSASDIRFGMMIKTLSGIELGGGRSAIRLQDSTPFVSAGKILRVEFTFVCALNTGTYFLNAGLMGKNQDHEGFLHRLVDIAMFRVMPNPSPYIVGIVDFGCVPVIDEIETS